MSKIESLSDLFELVDCQADFYDIGRHVTKMTATQINQFDQKQQPYPFAFKQQAWLAIVLTPNSGPKSEPIIWFLRLAIDEQGCLNLGTRDHLIKTIVDKILTNKEEQEQADLADALKDNPYAFQPDHERMASFHATLSLELERPPSHYFQELVTFLQGDLRKHNDQWQNIGLQGIADLAVRSHTADYAALIRNGILRAPAPLACALAIALEHEKPTSDYMHWAENIFSATSNTQMQAAMIRSISKGTPSKSFVAAIKTMVENVNPSEPDKALELIVAIVAKCPHWFDQDSGLLKVCMESLAHRDDGYLAFSQIAAELSQTPVVRGSLWQLFRSEDRSQKLSQAIGSLFAQAPTKVQ
ncbi:DUF3549 family protein [Marinomonas agarivorans]|nr:DUF3549 family protein [Marinomonas agarivorans]